MDDDLDDILNDALDDFDRDTPPVASAAAQSSATNAVTIENAPVDADALLEDLDDAGLALSRGEKAGVEAVAAGLAADANDNSKLNNCNNNNNSSSGESDSKSQQADDLLRSALGMITDQQQQPPQPSAATGGAGDAGVDQELLRKLLMFDNPDQQGGGDDGDAAAGMAAFMQMMTQLGQAQAQAQGEGQQQQQAPPDLGHMTNEALDAEMAKMLQAMGMGDLSMGGEGGGTDGAPAFDPAEIDKMTEQLMSKLLSRDALYQPIKDIAEKYPDWLAKNEGKVPDADYERYQKQHECFVRIRAAIDEEEKQAAEKNSNNDSSNSGSSSSGADPSSLAAGLMGPHVTKLMEELQQYGDPPPDIIATLVPPGAEAAGAAAAGLGGMPGLGPNGLPPGMTPEMMEQMAKEMEQGCKTQ